jgi:hypothetical protein
MFKDRYREHIQAIRTNKLTSRYAQHIFDTGHTYGTIEETMEIMQVKRKGHLLNTLESEKKIQMNDTFADVYNPIFSFIINNRN